MKFIYYFFVILFKFVISGRDVTPLSQKALGV